MNNICCAILTIFASIFILVVIGLLLAGCEMPISTWNVNETIDAVQNHGDTICHSDGFDHICFVPQPVEVIIEVPIEKIVEVEKLVTVEIPGETQVIKVYTEVEVPVDPIVQVVTDHIEVPVEVIKIVETEKIVEVPIEVPGPTVYVDREIIKIVEVEVEKIVNVPVEVKVIEYVEVEKEVEVIKEVEKTLSEYTAEEIKAEYKRRGFTPEVVTQVVTSSNCDIPLEVYSNEIAPDNSKLDYWEIGIIYPGFLLGEDYYYGRKGFPRKNEDGTYDDGFEISISVGGTTYTEKDLTNQKYLIGGNTPVCVHYDFLPETKPSNFEVTVTAEFDGVKYKFQGTLGE